MQPKRSLIRIVCTPEGVQVDPSGKLAGRGAYLHELRYCWEQGMKGSLARALRTVIHPEDHNRLAAFMTSLPQETPPETK